MGENGRPMPLIADIADVARELPHRYILMVRGPDAACDAVSLTAGATELVSGYMNTKFFGI